MCWRSREGGVDDLDLELALGLVGVLARAAAAAREGEHGEHGSPRGASARNVPARVTLARSAQPAGAGETSSATGSRCGGCARATPAPFAAAFREDPKLGVLIGADEDPTENSVRRFIARQPGLRARGEFLGLAVTDATKRPFLGHVMLHTLAWRHRRAEIGYWLVPSARGQGVGRQAVSLLVDWAFETLELERHRDHHDARQRRRAGARRVARVQRGGRDGRAATWSAGGASTW